MGRVFPSTQRLISLINADKLHEFTKGMPVPTTKIIRRQKNYRHDAERQKRNVLQCYDRNVYASAVELGKMYNLIPQIIGKAISELKPVGVCRDEKSSNYKNVYRLSDVQPILNNLTDRKRKRLKKYGC